ncbi:S-adenosyl-L-methionine-dependent methyltransferase [Xylaria digitata]|nr:S-adenosyl-L-methionine-dependent methyltransferase [Xylaria digitata]
MDSNTKATNDYDPSAYWRAGNFNASARLHLQYLLCQNTLGFLLENHIEQSIPTFPTTTYSKSPTLLVPLPQHLIGAYDVVHVRAFVSLVLNEDTTPLLSTVLAFLKPGVWLQWEEFNPDILIEPAVPSVQKTACEALAQSLQTSHKSTGLCFDFLANLDQYPINHGFQNVHMFETVNCKQDFKSWTDNFLMVWEQIIPHLPSKITKPQASITREFWIETFSKAIEETEKGVALHPHAIITAVGRKPI